MKLNLDGWLEQRGIVVLANRDTEELWLQERLAGITASDISALMGDNPWRTPLDVYLAKKGVKADEISAGNELKVWMGNQLEGSISSWWGGEVGLLTLNCNALLCKAAMPILRVTPDHFVVDKDGEIVALLEIKTSGRREDWADGEIPRHVFWQCQAQMAVVPVPRVYLAVITFGPGGVDRRFWTEVERSDEAIEDVWEKTIRFETRLDQDNPPEAGANDHDNLRILYPTGTPDGVVPLEAKFLEHDERLQELAFTMLECEKEKKTLQAELKQAIGAATFGTLPNGVSYSWKEVNRKEHTVKASSSRQLRRKKAKK